MIDLALDGRVFIRNKLDEAVQELDILFNTELTELIGYPQFGCDFEQFSWQISPSTDALKKYIQSKIVDTVYLNELNVDIDVDVIKGEYRFIYQVKIKIYDDNENNSVERNYEFR